MLDFKSICRMAIISLKINKMRSMLTSLGIIIGVSAVIIMLAVGAGASKKIAADMDLTYISTNFRKNDGFLKTNRISKELNLYRQNYCGCKFAIQK